MVDNWSFFRQLIKLGNCLACKQALPLFEDFCPGCIADLPVIQAHCPGCGGGISRPSSANLRCGKCQKRPRPFAHVHALFHYQQPVSTYIHQLKYRNRLDLARTLGTLMASQLKAIHAAANAPALIIPIPLHPSRLIARGYNQALELARPIAKNLQIPLDYKTLIRVRKTMPHMELSIRERKKNIHNAFAVTNDSLVGKNIALVDDVFTTGLTAETATRTLLSAGAASVECWVLARAGKT
jgi:ComF family protein